MTFYQVIHPVSLFTVLIVDHRVIEIIDMTACLPRRWVHENRRINTYNVLIHAVHAVPPLIFYISFQLATPLAIIINCLEAVIYFTGWKNKAVLFAMRNYCLKPLLPYDRTDLFVCHRRQR